VSTVCVPSESIRDRLADLDVEVLVWDWRAEPPPGLDRVELVVPPYMDRPPQARALAALPNLRVVQLLSAGYESWPPVLPPGVLLCNGRGIHGASTAELAVGGLISLTRNLPRLLDQQRQARWVADRTDGLDGKRVLILGVGDIGGRVAAAVTALGATATLVGRTARDGVHALDQVADLLPDHDVVVVALPYSDRTHRLVDAKFLAGMPDGARLVNVARGAIVETDALLAELTSERLSAFLDVTDPEPLPADHPLWSAPNVLITPHIGGGTTGWQRRAEDLVRTQVQRLLAGEGPLNVVNAA
jgi:phosphoglycerate dehydrogenase-like enzyme